MTSDSRSGISEQSALVRATLKKANIHDMWDRAFLTPEGEDFMELVFDYIVKYLNAPKGQTILDAGCGNGHNCVRLARKGFKVEGIDFSAYRVEAARARVAASGLGDQVKVSQQDLTRLTYPNDSFEYIVSWGVLMHIPDLSLALSELARILKPGGTLVLGENNKHSLDAAVFWMVRKIQGRRWDLGENSEYGRELWVETPHGRLLIRFADIQRLISELSSQDLLLQKRHARQYTELFLRTRSPFVRKCLHAFNRFWFRWIGLPQLALGNLLIFKKRL